VQHEESFLQLTLSALSSLCSHDCCRCQLVYDLATKELLSRIARVATHVDTQNIANRLLSVLWIQDMQEESQADVEEAKINSICDNGGEAECWQQELPFESSSASTKKHSLKHYSETGAEDNDECWDPSDYEEDGIADHHSDACSVASFHSRSSAYSRDSSQFSRSSRRTSLGQRSAEIDCEAEAEGISSSYASDHDSNRFSDVELNSFGEMFSEASDDELDVEQPSKTGVRLTTNEFGPHGRETRGEEERAVGETSASKDPAADEDGPMGGGSQSQGRGNQHCSSNLEMLIAKQKLRLEIHGDGEEYDRGRILEEDKGQADQEPGQAPLPLSGEGYGLPPAMLNALHYRPMPLDKDVDLLHSQNLKQKLIDAWLDVAELSQRNKVALAKCRRQRDRRAVSENLRLWREALITEESDNDTPREHSEVRHPSSDCSSSTSCPACYHEASDSAGAKAGHQVGCCCGGEDLSPDGLLSHPFLLDCKESGGKDAVDLMTVASEASTRSLGSENSNMSLYEWSAPCFCPALANSSIPASPSCRSAEAALEASTKVMVSLLEKNGWAAKEERPEGGGEQRSGSEDCREAM